MSTRCLTYSAHLVLKRVDDRHSILELQNNQLTPITTYLVAWRLKSSKSDHWERINNENLWIHCQRNTWKSRYLNFCSENLSLNVNRETIGLDFSQPTLIRALTCFDPTPSLLMPSVGVHSLHLVLGFTGHSQPSVWCLYPRSSQCSFLFPFLFLIHTGRTPHLPGQFLLLFSCHNIFCNYIKFSIHNSEKGCNVCLSGFVLTSSVWSLVSFISLQMK